MANGTAKHGDHLGVGDASERVRDAYRPAKFARLAALKRRYDPENVFHRNQIIVPAPALRSRR